MSSQRSTLRRSRAASAVGVAAALYSDRSTPALKPLPAPRIPITGAPLSRSRTSASDSASSSGVDSAFAASRSEEHTSELQLLMRISYAVFYLQKKMQTQYIRT